MIACSGIEIGTSILVLPLHRTPADVADRLAILQRELRFVHFAHWARLPGLSHEQRRSLLVGQAP